MKSLQESLFDKDLVKSDTEYEKLIKSLQRKQDLDEIWNWCSGFHSGDFDDVRNKYLRQWGEDLYEKYQGKILYPGATGEFTVAGMTESDKEAMECLGFGQIHTEVHWNDCMYGSHLEIPWPFWDAEKEGKDIFEWIMVNRGPWVSLIVNRKSYDELDQKVIHTLIESLHKWPGKFLPYRGHKFIP